MKPFIGLSLPCNNLLNSLNNRIYRVGDEKEPEWFKNQYTEEGGYLFHINNNFDKKLVISHNRPYLNIDKINNLYILHYGKEVKDVLVDGDYIISGIFRPICKASNYERFNMGLLYNLECFSV